MRDVVFGCWKVNLRHRLRNQQPLFKTNVGDATSVAYALVAMENHSGTARVPVPSYQQEHLMRGLVLILPHELDRWPSPQS